jgi:hypothetical protein
LQAQGTWPTGQDDGKDRFLADLRALRDRAAMEFDELAARAHYPTDVLKEAESGPSLPSLPILAAYVRACAGDVPQWEERWRRLGFDSRADPSLPVRPAGASPAAVAGARAAVSVAPPDVYDPERIKAALRGSHGGSGRGSHDTAAAAEPRVPESPARWSAGTGWDGLPRDGFPPDAGARRDDPADNVDGTSANGNHHVSQPGHTPSGTTAVETPDTVRRDPFSASWLQQDESASPPGTESGWPDRTAAGPPAAAADSWFTPREKEDGEQAWPGAEAGPPPAAADTWFTPREWADGTPSQSAEHGAAPPQEHTVTGFWTPSAATSARGMEIQRPGPPSAQAASAVPSRTVAGPPVPPGPVVPPREPRPDRLYPARLLVVIVVAALIGSILVLLLR